MSRIRNELWVAKHSKKSQRKYQSAINNKVFEGFDHLRQESVYIKRQYVKSAAAARENTKLREVINNVHNEVLQSLPGGRQQYFVWRK